MIPCGARSSSRARQSSYPEGRPARRCSSRRKRRRSREDGVPGLGFAFFMRSFRNPRVIEETPWCGSVKSRVFRLLPGPAISPRVHGCRLHHRPRIAGVLWRGRSACSGSSALASLVPRAAIAELSKLGYLADVTKPGAFGWNPEAQAFVNLNRPSIRLRASDRPGAVAAGGFMTLIRPIPTIVSAFRGSIASRATRRGRRDPPHRQTCPSRWSWEQPVALFIMACFPSSRRRARQNRPGHDRRLGFSS